jgi:putative IMPACT (imprinted ancient) family translation regulator
VLQVLESQAVVAALATVVRYFGGIKLGAGGLVRAYAEAAGKALGDAVLKPLIRKVLLRVRVSFSHLSAVEGVAARERITVLDRGFEPEPQILLEVPEARRAAIECALRDLTGGTVSVTVERSRKRPHGEPDQTD